MSLIVKKTGDNFEPIPLGVHQAVCAFVEDIGTHEGSYQGRPTLRHQVVICWELNAAMRDGRPFMVSKFYTFSLGDKAHLRKDLESWRGKAFTAEELEGFDLESLLGVNCMLNVIAATKMDGTVTQKIGAIMPKITDMPILMAENKTPPEWIAKKRMESIEAKEANLSTEEQGITSEDGLPF